jgi:hypothetical protein
MELIWKTTQQLIEEGMPRPSIRAVLYRLLSAPGWNKDCYSRLCAKLGEWRDEGYIPFGVYSDESGARSRPLTSNEIKKQIEAWQKAEPAVLPEDGILKVLLVEHESLVSEIREWTDDRAIIVSSAGQIKRENLYTAIQEWHGMMAELQPHGPEGIEPGMSYRNILVYGLVDYDKGGRDIDNAHRIFFNEHAVDYEPFGLNEAQLTELGLATDEDWQIDGVFGLNLEYWKSKILSLLGFAS